MTAYCRPGGIGDEKWSEVLRFNFSHRDDVFGSKRSAKGRVLPSSVVEIRAMLLSPYCAELAGLKLQRFHFSPALPACCGSL